MEELHLRKEKKQTIEELDENQEDQDNHLNDKNLDDDNDRT